MRTGDSVVNIGGAPFVPPYTIVRPIDTNNVSSYAYYSTSGFYSSGSKHSPTTSPSSTSSSPSRKFMNLAPESGSGGDITAISPSNSFGSNSSKDSDNSGGVNSPQLEAALRYSSALHEHTRKMWEKERSSIEKQKFESLSPPAIPITSSTTSDISFDYLKRQKQQYQQQQQQEQQRRLSTISNRRSSLSVSNRRSSLGSSLGFDLLWSRRRRNTKGSMS